MLSSALFSLNFFLSMSSIFCIPQVPKMRSLALPWIARLAFLLCVLVWVAESQNDLPHVALGTQQTCIAALGLLLCWGGNWSGQLGSGSTSPIGTMPNEISSMDFLTFATTLGTVTSVSTGSHITCALFDSGRVACFGLGSEGSPGLDSPDRVGCGGSCLSIIQLTGIGFADPTVLVTAIASGGGHNCAIFSNGKIRW